MRSTELEIYHCANCKTTVINRLTHLHNGHKLYPVSLKNLAECREDIKLMSAQLGSELEANREIVEWLLRTNGNKSAMEAVHFDAYAIALSKFKEATTELLRAGLDKEKYLHLSKDTTLLMLVATPEEKRKPKIAVREIIDVDAIEPVVYNTKVSEEFSGKQETSSVVQIQELLINREGNIPKPTKEKICISPESAPEKTSEKKQASTKRLIEESEVPVEKKQKLSNKDTTSKSKSKPEDLVETKGVVPHAIKNGNCTVSTDSFLRIFHVDDKKQQAALELKLYDIEIPFKHEKTKMVPDIILDVVCGIQKVRLRGLTRSTLESDEWISTLSFDLRSLTVPKDALGYVRLSCGTTIVQVSSVHFGVPDSFRQPRWKLANLKLMESYAVALEMQLEEKRSTPKVQVEKEHTMKLHPSRKTLITDD